MRVDLYRRPEAKGRVSFLAVPESKKIPEEVINTDWQSVGTSVELAEHVARWTQYGIEHPESQIAEKGYAITSLNEQPAA